LVDLTPEALINRLERGDVYKGEKVPQALANFFRKENLAALRELALRRTADEVDEQLQDYLDVQKSEQAKAAHEHVVVCISPRPLSAKLVRRGYRIAKRLQANFDCIYIRVPGAKLSKSEEAAMQEITDLSRNLGGQVVELEGDSVAEEIIKYVQKTGCTMLVMGQSARSRTSEVLRGSIITKIMRQTKNMDIVIVADSKDEILDD
ncbi:MAG: universal stress protein, partial [Candidatus Margulisiibacteriota bacterium]